MIILFIYFNFGFSNINMSLAEGYKRNYKKEKGNPYCDHNMAGDYNTVPVLYLDMGIKTVMYYKCSHVPNLRRMSLIFDNFLSCV